MNVRSRLLAADVTALVFARLKDGCDSSAARECRSRSERGDQFLFVNKPEPDLAVAAAASQPTVRQHHQGIETALVVEDHGLATTFAWPKLDLAVLAAADQPLVRQHH
jgi:hypothetical protein